MNLHWRAGSNFILLAGVLLAISVACFMWSGAIWLLAPTLAVLAGLSFLDWRELREAKDELRITRSFPSSVGQGCDVEIIFNMQHLGVHPALYELREVLPTSSLPLNYEVGKRLLPGETVDFQFKICLNSRGSYPIGPTWSRRRGRWGCLEHQWAALSAQPIRVLPRCAVSKDSLWEEVTASPQLLKEWTKSRLRGEGSEFDTLSPFVRGDNISRIDWRSSAKHQQLLVRRYQLEQHREIMILMDCGRLMGSKCVYGTKFDLALNSGLMLARVALEKGDRCGVAVFDNEVLGYLPPMMGRGQYYSLLECLYDKEGRMRETDFSSIFATLQTRQKKRCLIVILSDIIDLDTTEKYRGALAALSKRHVVLFAALRTPLLYTQSIAAPESEIGLAQNAVCMRLLREREEALHTLRHAGIQVIDTDPRQLTVPLINQYVSLRQQNLV